VISLQGVVMSGLGQGAQFMGLPWVRDVIRRMIGFDPYPGTFNVRLVDPSMVATWRRIRQGPGLRVEPPAPEQCGARLFVVVVAPDVVAAVIVPDVTRHGDDVLELVAPVHVRGLLGLRDDDPVTLQIP
jgi:riboflavin kinase